MTHLSTIRKNIEQRLISMMCRANDFPKPGIEYLNVLLTMTRHPELFSDIVSCFCEEAQSRSANLIVGIESRGFVFGAPVAVALSVPFVPMRKAGKLPPPVHSLRYNLEYGSDTLEISQDAAAPGSRVLLIDDILATGGTARAAADLLTQAGHTVAALAFVGEIIQLQGHSKLEGYDIISLAGFTPHREDV